MRPSLVHQRPPSLLEQALGRTRSRTVRRRAGFAAIGAGFSMLKPRTDELDRLVFRVLALVGAAGALTVAGGVRLVGIATVGAVAAVVAGALALRAARERGWLR